MTWFELATIAAVAGWNLVTYWALWMAVTRAALGPGHDGGPVGRR